MLEDITSTLTEAGVAADRLDEVRELVRRSPGEVGVAILGPHNAGKTTLIAVITDDPGAKQDIGPVVMTQASVAYRYTSEGTAFLVWDTPGLGSEFLDHDAEARDRLTRADAVVLAMSSDLVSQRGRDQLDELLTVGRKRGAILLAITKADREPVENRPGILEQVRLSFPDLGTEPIFVSAGDALDAREDGEDEPEGSGMPEFVQRLENLALGEARERMKATAAVRLLVLIDDAGETLATEEPEQNAALTVQRRLRRVLKRADRRMTEAGAMAGRKGRLAALQGSATVANALDQRLDAADIEKVAEEAWQTFVAAAARHEEDLAEAMADELRKATAELERLEAGSLAAALRHTAGDLDEHAYGQGAAGQTDDFKFERALLDAVKRAANLMQGAKIALKGKAIPAGTILGVGAEALDWYLASKEAAAVAEAKRSVREAYLAEADKLSERWDEYVSEIRDDTTRRLLAETEKVEDELFARLVGTQEQQRKLKDARDHLDRLIDDAIATGHADAAVVQA